MIGTAVRVVEIAAVIGDAAPKPGKRDPYNKRGAEIFNGATTGA